MTRSFRNLFKRLWGTKSREINPDEIFLDSSNLPQFDTHQFEGRIEQAIPRKVISMLGGVFLVLGCAYVVKVSFLQIRDGQYYSDRSKSNSLRQTVLFAERGVIYDRNAKELAWNIPGEDSVTQRKYIDKPGMSHVLGYVKYPSQDKYGFYYTEDFTGIDGVEKYYDAALKGVNGTRIIEVNAFDKVQSESVVKLPQHGTNLTLTIDSRVQNKLFEIIRDTATKVGYDAGSGVLMDITNGDVIAITSYPEYNSETLSSGSDTATIRRYSTDPARPYLDRAVDGVYTPGSIVKPMVALGALTEGVIDPYKQILSTGSISLPNQYDPTKQTVFKDWRAQGWVDMRHALAVSSDVYFYEVGGGFKDQKGLGITKLDTYFKMFGLGDALTNSFFSGAKGLIPTPAWKKATFDGEEWTIGDTYHTAIGQYGFQVTPIQMVRVAAAIANSGKLINPTILKDDPDHIVDERDIPIKPEYFQIVREGMRLGVLEGTAKVLNVPYVHIASKSGTAELGVSKDKVNSWIMGFFPYEHPRYAFAITMEKGSVHNLVGSGVVMANLVQWMNENTPEYFK